MKIAKKLLPFVVVLALVAFAYSFFHIDGREIKLANKLAEAKSVTIIVMNTQNNENVEYDLNKEQIEKIKTIILENSYTRRISKTIIGELPDKRYTIFATWDDAAERPLHISLLGGEYIHVLGDFGSRYHKIKNTDFEKELISILDSK